MVFIKRLLVFLSLAFVPIVRADFLPENDFKIPISFLPSGIDEQQFNAIIDKVVALYSPVVTSMGAELKVNRDWINEKVNAATMRSLDGKSWIITLYGGLARHPETTPDSFALVICHELGHHLGGAPKKTKGTPPEAYWPSTEGEADYFATLKCLRKVFADGPNADFLKVEKLSSTVQANCFRQFKTRYYRGLCIRSSLAAEASARVSATIRLTDMPSFDVQDPSVVETIYEKHPLPQCRLDTYLNGALCPASSKQNLSDSDFNVGACYKETEHRMGDRPFCWFRPQIKRPE